jgi:hypothetical protein
MWGKVAEGREKGSVGRLGLVVSHCENIFAPVSEPVHEKMQ